MCAIAYSSASLVSARFAAVRRRVAFGFASFPSPEAASAFAAFGLAADRRAGFASDFVSVADGAA
ncbi:MAG: hypothetical protein ACLGH4_07430, partial [Actinomycetes bacterium]